MDGDEFLHELDCIGGDLNTLLIMYDIDEIKELAEDLKKRIDAVCDYKIQLQKRRREKK